MGNFKEGGIKYLNGTIEKLNLVFGRRAFRYSVDEAESNNPGLSRYIVSVDYRKADGDFYRIYEETLDISNEVDDFTGISNVIVTDFMEKGRDVLQDDSLEMTGDTIGEIFGNNDGLINPMVKEAMDAVISGKWGRKGDNPDIDEHLEPNRAHIDAAMARYEAEHSSDKNDEPQESATSNASDGLVEETIK